MRKTSFLYHFYLLHAIIITEAFIASNNYGRKSQTLQMGLLNRVRVPFRKNKVTPSSSNKSNSENKVGAFGSFKDAVYDSFDGVKSLTKRIQIGGGKQQSVNVIVDQRPSEGYTSTVILQEASSSSAKNGSKKVETPGAKLLRQYAALDRQDGLIPDGDASSSSSESSPFVQIKDGLYFAADVVSGKNELKNMSREEKVRPLKSDNYDSLNTFRPISKLSMREDNVELQRLIPNLASKNPLVRLRAEAAVKKLEKMKKKREQQARREQNLKDFKANIYATIDAGKSVVDVLAKTPKVVASVAASTEDALTTTVREVQKLPRNIEKTVEEVQSVPSKVERKFTEIKTSAENAQKIATVVVDDIKSIPTNVEKTINDTKSSVEKTVSDTRRTVDDIGNAVNEISTTVKVISGVEKPKPKPPPPPPVKSTKEIAMDVAGSVASGAVSVTGKAAWFLTKGAFGLGAKGVKTAWAATMKKRDEAKKTGDGSSMPRIDLKELRVLSRTAAMTKEEKIKENAANTALEEALKRARESALQASSDAMDTSLTTDISSVDPKLAMEVAEALESAKLALEESEKVKSMEGGMGKTTGIDESEEVTIRK